MQLRDAGIGDIISIPTCWPRLVMVVGMETLDVICGVILVRLTWASPDEDGCVTLSELTRVERLWIAYPDAPIKKTAHDPWNKPLWPWGDLDINRRSERCGLNGTGGAMKHLMRAWRRLAGCQECHRTGVVMYRECTCGSRGYSPHEQFCGTDRCPNHCRMAAQRQDAERVWALYWPRPRLDDRERGIRAWRHQVEEAFATQLDASYWELSDIVPWEEIQPSAWEPAANNHIKIGA